LPDRLFIGVHVVIPKPTLLGVVEREFPVLVRVIEPLQKTLLLLPFGNVKEEFHHNRSVAKQVTLERADVLESLFPDAFRDAFRGELWSREKFRMHPYYQRLLIAAAIENADPAALGQLFNTTPQVIVIQM